jgi:hypothetical protein
MARARERRDGTATGSLLNDDATGRGALEVAFVIHAVLDVNKKIQATPHVQAALASCCIRHGNYKPVWQMCRRRVQGAGSLGRNTLGWYDSRIFSRRLQAQYRVHCAWAAGVER